MTLKLTILGCGSSAGVPRIGNDWGRCDPLNPRNRRLRCSLLVAKEDTQGNATRLLVDTSPDMREQMLHANVPSLDAVWYTHEHADHTHGIDELRAYYLMQRQRIPCFADAATGGMLQQRFAYCFQDQDGYPAIAALNLITPGQRIAIVGGAGEISALPIEVHHGSINALCFRFGNAAYLPDTSGLNASALGALAGLDVLIIDALRYARHPSHLSLGETLDIVSELRPKRAVLTNMHIDLDYATLLKELPENVVPGHDGMVLSVQHE